MKNKCQFKVGDRVVVVRDRFSLSDYGNSGNNTKATVGDVLTVSGFQETTIFKDDCWVLTEEHDYGIISALLKPFTIEAGKRYVRRDGTISGIIDLNYNSNYSMDWVFQDGHRTYRENGTWDYDGLESPRDLMKEYIEPESHGEWASRMLNDIRTQPKTEQMKKTVEVSEDFVKQAHESACSTWKEKIEKEFPSLFNGKELTKGKWYKNALDGIFLFDGTFSISSGDKRPNGYGTNCNEWFDGDDGIGWSIIGIKEATKQQVFDALKKEAERRGFKEGEKCLSLAGRLDGTTLSVGGNTCLHGDICGGHFFLEDGMFWVRCNDYNALIFQDGKWAEVIKEEPIKEVTLEEVAKMLGVAIDKLRIKD